MVLDDAKDGISAIVCSDAEILTGSTDGRVRCYDVRMGKLVVDVQPGPVTSLSLGGDRRTLLVSCLDGKIRLLDRENGSCLRTFPPEKGFEAESGKVGYRNESLRLQSCLAVNDGLVLNGSEADGCVRAWDVVSGKEVSCVEVSKNDTGAKGKVVSVVKWREGSDVDGRKGLWAAGGADSMVRIYGS